MARPDLSRAPKPFHTYINKVTENDVMDALRNQTPLFIEFLEKLPAAKRDYRYAKDKWTIKEMLQHIVDAERVFAYRALCFARKEAASLPSFDENDYADNSKADARKWEELIEEFRLMRKSNEIMFGSFDNEQLESSGIVNNNPNYVLAMGFTMVGHINHHLGVIKERYLQ
jgi:uncharacterized damage-inducible protein DinB